MNPKYLMSGTLVSLDTEFTGPVPGKHAMIELGACTVYGLDTKSFTSSLNVPSNMDWDEATMKWWIPDHGDQLNAIMDSRVKPQAAMVQFYQWLQSLPQPITYVMFPSHVDYAFLSYYFYEYLGQPLNHRRIIDGKTLAYVALMQRGGAPSLDKMGIERLRIEAPEWFSIELPHTHRALDDALEQAHVYRQIMAELTKGVR